MKIDLHCHSQPGTPEALSTAEEMVAAATRAGLDAVVLTERGFLRGRWQPWNAPYLDGLAERHGVKVFSGLEVPTTFGDLLVYGVCPDMDFHLGATEVVSVVSWARENGGAVTVPNLFRNRSPEQRRQIAEDGIWDWWLRLVDALELTWATCRDDDAAIAAIADRLGKEVVRGTDAHHRGIVGRSFTETPDFAEVGELVGWLRGRDRELAR